MGNQLHDLFCCSLGLTFNTLPDQATRAKPRFSDRSLHLVTYDRSLSPRGATTFVRRDVAMAPPSLPTEIVARILDSLCEQDSNNPAPPYRTLFACVLVSKAFQPLAERRLYRHLEVKIRFRPPKQKHTTTDSFYLETALIRRRELGAATRTIKMVAEEPWEVPRDDRRGEAIIERCLWTLLECCPRVLCIELLGFDDPSFGERALLSLLRLVVKERTELEHLVVGGLYWEESDATFAIMRGLPSLKSLGFPSSFSNGTPKLDLPRWRRLSSLHLDSDGAALLASFANHQSRSLASLQIDMTPYSEPSDWSPNIAAFPHLKHLHVTLSSAALLDGLLEQLQFMARLESFALAIPMEGVCAAAAACRRNGHCSSLPFSLRRIDLTSAHLSFAAIYELIRQPQRKTCWVSWSEDGWSSTEQRLMEREVGSSDGARRRYIGGRRRG